MKQRNELRQKFFIATVILMLFACPIWAWALVATSTSFQITQDIQSIASSSFSTSYKLISAGGQTATGTSTSPVNFCDNAGLLYFLIPSATGNPTIASAANQTFEYGQSSTGASQITITATGGGQIRDSYDLRIAIATSTVHMLWDSSVTAPTFGGSASTKVAATLLPYQGGDSVLVIDVTSSFNKDDVLTISGVAFKSFTAINAAASALQIFKDGPSDFASDGNDSKSVAIKGKMTQAEHDGGQESNKFENQTSLTDSNLFRFKLTPSYEDATVNSLVISLSDIRGFSTGDLNAATLAIDYNGNGTVDTGDSAVGGGGSVSISGSTGTITFSSSFTATTSRNYILRASVSGISAGDEMTFGLPGANINSSGATSLASLNVYGPLSQARHFKSSGGGGTTETGGTGQTYTPIGGGTAGGGEEIGEELGFLAPTTNGSPSNYWTSPGNAYVSDNSYATQNTADLSQDYATFGFNIPSGNIIDGIEVKLETSDTIGAGYIQVALSGNSGSSYTSIKSTGTLTTSDVVYRLGGVSDTWGSSWDYSALGTPFRLKVTAQPNGTNTIKIDAIQARVYHHASGGGGGGGGEVYAPSGKTMLANVFETAKDLISTVITFFRRLFEIQ